MNPDDLSDGAVLMILIHCVTASVCLSCAFYQRHKAHLIWTTPTGFVVAFVALAILSVLGKWFLIIIGGFSFLFMLGFIFERTNKNKKIETETNHYERLFNQPENAKVLDDFERQAELQQHETTPQLKQEIEEKEKVIQEQRREIEQLKQAAKQQTTQPKPRTEPVKFTPLPQPETPTTATRSRGRPRTNPKRGSIVVFTYTNAEGSTSERTVRVSSIDGTYLNGRDLDKDVSRTFRRSRIHGGEVIDRDTGEVFHI